MAAVQSTTSTNMAQSSPKLQPNPTKVYEVPHLFWFTVEI